MRDLTTRVIDQFDVDRWRQCPRCHAPVMTKQSRQEVLLMSDPPRTANRWVVTTRWQCYMYEIHHGEFWKTTDEAT